MYGEIFREIRDFRVTISNAEGLSFFCRDKNFKFLAKHMLKAENMFLCHSV